uniref:Putative conserved secreted protein n=1 Tax=Amblyomma aureolatum TaxID=187763 RepID=A0A1E1X339_9ACAR
MGRFWTVAALCLALTSLACFAQDPTYKGFSELLSKSYHVDVELTSTASNESEFIREYHNREDGTGYMEMLVEGMTSYMYYFQETDEEVTFLDNTCTISKLSEKGAVFDGKTVYAGPSANLHQLPTNVMKYVGAKTVRGVTTNHFQGVHNEKLYNVYVRTSDWTENGEKKGEVPVRMEIVQQKGVDHAIYDFYNFEPYKPKIGEMNLKTGIGCEGKKNPSSKKLPTLPNQISFQYEIYYQEGSSPEQHVTVNKIWYDGTNKVARVELFQNTATTTAEIHDFNSGVMYSFDKQGSCKIDHLSKSYFSWTMEDREIETMKTPAQMLELVGDFYYVGQAVIRGVACDIWESVRTNVTIETERYDRLVTTFYFTSLQWFSAGAQLDKFVPLRRETAGSKPDASKRVWTPERHSVNYFDFVEEDKLDETFLWNFDIRECFITKTYLDLLFISDKNVSEATFWENRDTLLETVWEKLYTLPKISPLRIPKPQIGFLEDGSIHVVALLLPAPGAIASFVDTRNYVPGDKMDHAVKMPTQEDCAQRCLNDPQCRTFIYCDHECFFSPSNRPRDWGRALSKRNCQRYSKADDNISVTFVNNSEVVRVLQNEVQNGALVLKVAGKEQQGAATFKAVRLNTDASPFNAQHSSGLYQVAYSGKVLSLKADTTMRAVMLDGKNEITSVQQCYRNCITESGTECASFSYCPATKDCRLSSIYIMDDDQASKSLELETRCTVYARSYINMYEKFPGTVSRVGGDITKDNVPDENQCAQLCKHDKLVRCRGFEYCPRTKHCVLHEKHFLDIRPEDIINGTEACSHYAQKFSADYWEGAKGELDDPNSITISLIGFEDCAKQCSLDPAGRCKSFNFCPGDDGPDRKCVLNSLSIFDVGKDRRLKESKDCSFYFQQDHVNDFIHYNEKQALAPAKGYTSGGLGGLLFGMLILGLVLGVAGFTAFNYLRSRRGGADNTTVRFMRHEDNS